MVSSRTATPARLKCGAVRGQAICGLATRSRRPHNILAQIEKDTLLLEHQKKLVRLQSAYLTSDGDTEEGEQHFKAYWNTRLELSNQE